MSNEEMQKLRELAEEARDTAPRQWKHLGGGRVVMYDDVQERMFDRVADCWIDDSIAHYMVATQPSALLGLLDDNKRMREALEAIATAWADCDEKMQQAQNTPNITNNMLIVRWALQLGGLKQDIEGLTAPFAQAEPLPDVGEMSA